MAKFSGAAFLELLKGVNGVPGLLDPEVAALELGRPDQLQIALLAQLLISNVSNDHMANLRAAIAGTERERRLAAWRKECDIAKKRGVPSPNLPADLDGPDPAPVAAPVAEPAAVAPVAAVHPNAPAEGDQD